jgi:hypothetical protein
MLDLIVDSFGGSNNSALHLLTALAGSRSKRNTVMYRETIPRISVDLGPNSVLLKKYGHPIINGMRWLNFEIVSS